MFSKKYPGDMKWLAGLDAGAMDSWVFDGVHVSKIDCYLPMLLVQLPPLSVSLVVCIFSSPELSGSQGELIVYPCSVVRRPPVRPSSTIFKDLLL